MESGGGLGRLEGGPGLELGDGLVLLNRSKMKAVLGGGSDMPVFSSALAMTVPMLVNGT